MIKHLLLYLHFMPQLLSGWHPLALLWHFVHSSCLTCSILSSALHLVPGVSGRRHTVSSTRVGSKTCIPFLLTSPEIPAACISCDYSHMYHIAGRTQDSFPRRILPLCYTLHTGSVFVSFSSTGVSAKTKIVPDTHRRGPLNMYCCRNDRYAWGSGLF